MMMMMMDKLNSFFSGSVGTRWCYTSRHYQSRLYSVTWTYR